MKPMLKPLIHRVATLDVDVANKWTKVNIQLIKFILQYSICKQFVSKNIKEKVSFSQINTNQVLCCKYVMFTKVIISTNFVNKQTMHGG